MADVTYIPDQQGQNNILPWMLASQNGGFGGMNSAWPWLLAGGGFGGFGGFGGAGLGTGILGFLLGAVILVMSQRLKKNKNEISFDIISFN